MTVPLLLDRGCVTRLADGLRKADELPYHLLQAAQWQELAAALAEIDVFVQLYNKRRKYELIAFWREAIGRKGAEPGTMYLVNVAFARTAPSTEELAEVTSKART